MDKLVFGTCGGGMSRSSGMSSATSKEILSSIKKTEQNKQENKKRGH